MNLLKTVFAIFGLLAIQAGGKAQMWTNFQSQQQINDLVETDTELLLATDNGLVVINKTTLEKTIFNKSNSSLTNNHIQSITRDDSGKSWIGTYDMIIGYFDGSDIVDQTFPTHPANTQNTELYDYQIAPNGDVWMAADDGVFHRQGNNWVHYDEDEFGPQFFEAWDIAINEEEEIFMAGRAIHKFSNGTWTNISEGSTLEGYLDANLFFSSDGDLFVSGDLESIGRYDGQSWQEYDIDFNGSQVVGFTEDQDGNVFFYTQVDGIYKFENDTWVQQSNAQTSAVNNVTPYFYIDQNNNQWLNSDIHLSVNENGTIRNTLIAPHTLETNYTQSISKGLNGKMYFITGSQNNFSVVDADENWSFLPKPESANEFEVFQEILALADDDIWALSIDALYHYDGNSWTRDESVSGNSIKMDSQGKFYIRKWDRIVVMDDGNISEITPGNSVLSDLLISSHGIDLEDNLWIATADYYEPNVIQKLSTNGIWSTYSALNHDAIDRPIGDFHFPENGDVWVPNDNVGAIKFDGIDFTNPIAENIGAIENYGADVIQSDADGKIYFSHMEGATTFQDGILEDLLVDDLTITSTSGWSSLSFDDQGNLWWGSTREGVFRYNAETTNTRFPEVQLINAVTMYPNPTSEFATLNFSTLNLADVEVSITNNLGQLIYRKSLGALLEGDHQEEVDVSNLTSGFYTIILKVNDQISSQLLVVE